MKLSRIETFTATRKESYNGYYHFQNEDFNKLINKKIYEYENAGFEVSNTFKEIYDGFFYICIEFTKEGETDEV